jgi:hypothetical protein
MMSWDKFCADLKRAKKEKKSKGLSVPSIAALLYGGAFDSMLPEDKPRTAENYKIWYDQARTALSSKASLAKKRKTELIGLADVDGPVSLSLWRHQVNPLSAFDIISTCRDDLKMYGFVDTSHQAYPMKRLASDSYRAPVLLTPYWAKVFQNKQALEAFEAGEYELGILGVITDVQIKPYSDGAKERLVFRMFTGSEYTDEITVWPDRTGKITEHIRGSVQQLEMGFAIVRPKSWNGRPGATLLKWQKIIKARGA